MNISQFVTDLENLGVHLWEDSGQLRFRAPGGVLTGARRDLLREHKPAVLAHLRRLTETQALTPDTAARHEPFPLTDVQASYLLGRSDAYPCGGVACTAYLEIRFDPFDPGLAERAWRQLVGRHDALRTVVHADGYQRVLPRVPDYRIAVTDLRGAAAGTVDEAVLATREEMVSAEFAPDRWPLFDLRATWCDAHTVVHLSVDMLIGDYASVHLLVAELDQLCHDPDRRLPPLAVGFRDYVLAERALDHSGRRQRDRDYWWSRLGDLSSETSETPETLGTPEVPALPPRPGLPTVDGTSPLRRFRRIQTRLSARESSGIRSRAGAHGVTTSGALLAAYAETIARWSGQRRFTLNLPMFNRLPLHPQVDRLVGDFTSVTLLAVDHAATDSFASRATAIQAQLWRDLDHRGCSGVEVLRELARRRGRDASLMPVVFTSTLGLPDAVPDADAGDDRPGARHGEIVFGCSRTPQVWIDCQVMEDRGALVVGWDVREGLLPPGLADDAFGAFCSLVGDLAGSDAAWERSAGVRLPPAQLAARRRANDTAAPLPDRLLHSDIVAQAISTPDRTAVVDATRVLTYRELLTEANAVATELRATGDPTGDPAGTVVAVLMDKGWEQVVAVLGVLLAGAAYLPIDPAGPPSRTNAMLTDAGVRTVLTQPWTVADLPDRDVVRVRAGGSTDTGARTPATPASTGRTVDPDDLAYVIYTSGSTGRPNGVMISHRAARNTIDDINRRFGVNGDDRVLGLSGLSFDLSVYDIAGPLSRGGCLVLPTGHRRQDASYWAELIDRHGVTVWNSVPAQMQMLRYYLDSEPSVDLPSLRLALLSGDRIPTSLARRVAARLPGVSLVGLGGATEASIWSIVHPIGPDAAGRAAVPYGTPLTNQSFHVLDAELRDCPDWTPGELHIGGAGLAIGYLGDEPKTARRFIRHPVTGQRLYRTGDVGRYRDDGVIEILGRVDDQVKIRG
ncbi:MAG TPA: amino acid adenylation domain-containing protein, partial [Mycobacteriales bacterium]|nr:amino acid adenylation domain-containing protein [Mycobacteriales bacterium]